MEKENEIKYHNYLNELSLVDFSEDELNLFFYSCKKVQDKGEKTIVISYKELRDNCFESLNRNKILHTKLSSLSKKVINITGIRESEDGSEKIEYVIFQDFYINEKKSELVLTVGEKALYLFNDLFNNFTRLDFIIYKNLKSKYSKEIYRRLAQFSRTKIWRIKLEDFNRILCTPKSYPFMKINSRIIQPSINELKNEYPNLRIDYIYEKQSGRGRPKVKTLEFKWDKNYIIVNGKKVNPDTGEIYVEPIQNTTSIEEIDNTLKNLSATEEDALLELLLKKREQRKSQTNNYPQWASGRTKEIMNKRFLNE